MRSLLESLRFACHRARHYREATDSNKRCDTCHHYSKKRDSYCKLFECKVDPHAVCERFEEPRKGGTQRMRGPSLKSIFGIGSEK